ncbi:spore coat polysaccharide biosynthesis protein SpsF [Gammaproteobacteria bacterium]
MLARVMRRAARAKTLDTIVVATTTDSCDDVLVTECSRLGISCFRGSQEDVLDRYRSAAAAHAAEVIVRITSDCPLIDPEVIDQVVSAWQNSSVDYISNGPTWPRGLNVEVFSRAALEQAWEQAHLPWQRSHVTPYLYQNPSLFRIGSVSAPGDYGHLRWTVDTPEDLALVRSLYKHLGNQDGFGWREVLATVEQNPNLLEINRDISQKPIEAG